MAPSISQIFPQTIAAGTPSQIIKVMGTHFTSQAAILWNGQPLPTTIVDSNTLAGSVQSNHLATPATAQLQVQNLENGEQSQPVDVTVAPPSPFGQLLISSAALSGASVNQPYTAVFSALGGTRPYTWTITAGQLPPGLSMMASTGVVTGTPTASGTFTFTATVADSGNPQLTQSTTSSITVSPSQLMIVPPQFSAGGIGTFYSGTLQASGGTPGYTWSITSGSLPSGLSLSASTGVISGKPSVSGTSSFTVTVVDSGSPSQASSALAFITVTPSNLTITSSALASGSVGVPYSSSLQASGGTPSYTWAVTSGSLPAGLSLASLSGVISGTPTASGTSSFTISVTDAANPAQSVLIPDSITVGSSQLAITSSALSAGTQGVAYSAPLQASGGTPPYTWSIKSGSLPAGLTLSTAGVISGTPQTSGSSQFIAIVTDSGNPAQIGTAAITIAVGAATQATAGPGTTWYIRSDGGTRYSSNQPNGQCDGKGDAPYSGSGTNQHCAFGDYRYLWDDQSYGNSAWVISGGDTVIIRNGPWRVGFNQGASPNDAWCVGGNGPFACGNPTIPAGTATQHTRILGENYGSCSQSNMTQIFGGFGLGTVLNMGGAQYVDVQCLEITRHSQCIRHGNPVLPSGCNSSYPLDDYDSDGISTDVNTHDVLLQDLWIHGHTDRGIIGPIGGVVTAERVDIAYNGMAGWDFDDGSATPMGAGSLLNFKDSIIEWNGCNQEYPITHTFPAISCYSQSTGGYGDGIGTPAGTGLDVNVNHSIFRYNTQDGIDLGHVDTGIHTLSITNSTSYGNSGGQFKWGGNFTTATFENNIALANCLRMSAPMNGAPSTYNANLSDFCRAQDAISFNFRQGGTALFANNTVVSYAPTTFDIACWDSSCATSALTFENNLVLGYDNPATYSGGGQPGGPGGFYYQEPIGNIVRNNNLYHGVRSISCPTGNPNEICLDPLFVNEPTWNGEASLDNFDFNLTPGSPAKAAGVFIQNLTTDQSGATWTNPPSIGALE
jgi:Putative Ig domain